MRTIIRITLTVLVSLPLAWLAFAISLSLQAARHEPALAVRLWPGNSLAHAALADLLVQGTPTAPPLAARQEALRSLDEQPGNPVAARIIGATAGVSGNITGMDWWLTYSEEHSRRDLGTQLALIELAVSRGQVVAALTHYDRALRVFAPQPALVDVLVTATQGTPVRKQLVALLRRDPPWRESYLIQLVESGHASPEVVNAMVGALHLDQADPFDRRILGEAVTLLVAHGGVPAARTLVGIAVSGVRNGNFESGNPFPPLDWQLANDPDLSGVIEQGRRDRGGKALFLDARNGASGTVAEQWLSLLPGRYMLSLVTGDASADAAPTISIICAGHPAPLLSASLPSGPDATRTIRLPAFAVPADCAAQQLIITTAASTDPGPARPWIDDLRVSPAQ